MLKHKLAAFLEQCYVGEEWVVGDFFFSLFVGSNPVQILPYLKSILLWYH